MEDTIGILTLVPSHRASWQMAKDQAGPLLARLAEELPAHAVAAARERGRSRDLDTTVQELLVELGE